MTERGMEKKKKKQHLSKKGNPLSFAAEDKSFYLNQAPDTAEG
jgi:hypothetical protein